MLPKFYLAIKITTIMDKRLFFKLENSAMNSQKTLSCGKY
jgi:hypothetical protein